MRPWILCSCLWLAAGVWAADPTVLPGMGKAPAAPANVSGKDLCKEQFSDLKAQLGKDPENAKTWESFRACASELKRWGEAAEVSQAAIDQGSKQPGPHVVLGLSALHTKDYQKAADEFDSAISLKHDQPLAYYYLGMSYLFLKQPENAEKAAERAVELDPTSASNYSQLAYTELLMDKQDECEKAAKKAIEIDPNNVASYKVLGNLYAQQGKKAESDKMFEAAIHANGRTVASAPLVAGAAAGAGAASARSTVSPGPAVSKRSSEPEEPAVPVGEPEDLCRDQWNRMKDAMARGNTAEGLTYISNYLDTRQQYRQAFARMTPERMREIFTNLGDLDECKTVLQSVTCKSTATSSLNGEIRQVETTVRCERNEDKVWRIRSF